MLRAAGAVIAGLVAWIAVATLLNIGLRHLIPGYAAAEPVLAFTLTMKLARLTIAIIASLAAGYLAGVIAPASKAAAWIVGLVLLAVFLPEHIRIGARLPLWYHLFFLLTLAPLVWLGARLAPRRRVSRL